jgi:hypothetical protein
MTGTSMWMQTIDWEPWGKTFNARRCDTIHELVNPYEHHMNINIWTLENVTAEAAQHRRTQPFILHFLYFCIFCICLSYFDMFCPSQMCPGSLVSQGAHHLLQHWQLNIVGRQRRRAGNFIWSFLSLTSCFIVFHRNSSYLYDLGCVDDFLFVLSCDSTGTRSLMGACLTTSQACGVRNSRSDSWNPWNRNSFTAISRFQIQIDCLICLISLITHRLWPSVEGATWHALNVLWDLRILDLWYCMYDIVWLHSHYLT